MATPVVPNQFMVGKNRIVHKPTAATFSFDKNLTTFKSINWGCSYHPAQLTVKTTSSALRSSCWVS